jgi:pSer/pThr/pTyr-binding forkhead associated (FHA) protein
MTETQCFLRKVTTGKEIPIAPVMSVGRSEESGLRLTEGQPSRNHAKITADRSQVFVEDLDSTNGTFVNGRRLPANVKLKLCAGDHLRFDIEEFMFVAPASAADADKTVFRPTDPEKTAYRPPQPEPKAAEVAQRTVIEPRPPAAAAPPPREGPAAAKKDPSGAQAQVLPGSFADPKGTATVYVNSPKKPGQDGPAVAAPAHAAGDPPYFWIESGNSAGKRMEFKTDSGTKMTWCIGSGEECEVRLGDTGVSAKHAILRHDASTWLLIDDLSVNGTYVNDKKVLKGYLASGDRVRFGPVECRFYLPPPGRGARASGRALWRKYGLIAAGAFALTLALLYVAFRFMRQ